MILGAVLGLVGGIVPELLKMWRDKVNAKHELEMYKLQLEYADKEKELMKAMIEKVEDTKVAVEEIKAQAEMLKASYEFAKPTLKVTGNKFVDILQGIAYFSSMMVRPVITLMVFFLWLYGMKNGYQFQTWESEVMSGIMFFWFTDRRILRALGRAKW